MSLVVCPVGRDGVIFPVPLALVPTLLTVGNDNKETLALKVVQSADDNAPRLDADAVGTLSVMLPLVVMGEPEIPKSVPVVPNARPTLVTVPLPLLLNVFQSVDER
jgi:hypothetical protein